MPPPSAVCARAARGQGVGEVPERSPLLLEAGREVAVGHGRARVVEQGHGGRAERGRRAVVVEGGAEAARADAGEQHLRRVIEGRHDAAEVVAQVLVADEVLARGAAAVHVHARRVADVHVGAAVGHVDRVPVLHGVRGVRRVEDARQAHRGGPGAKGGLAEGGEADRAGRRVEAGAAALEVDVELRRSGVDAHADAGGRAVPALRPCDRDPGPLVGGRADRRPRDGRRRRADRGAAPTPAARAGAGARRDARRRGRGRAALPAAARAGDHAGAARAARARVDAAAAAAAQGSARTEETQGEPGLHGAAG